MDPAGTYRILSTLNIQHGIENSLIAKLNAARKSLLDVNKNNNADSNSCRQRIAI